MANKKNPALAKSPLVKELPAACLNEDKAVEFMERQRWGSDPACMTCGSASVYKMTDRTGARSKRYLWRCKDCNRQFTVRVGTVFEDSRIPLRQWCHAFWRACSSKKGVSALQISRELQISYKSALFMMHRIRWAMADGPGPEPLLDGTVEADETYVGGKPRYHGEINKGKMGRGTDKAPVVAIVQRGGNARAFVVPGRVRGHVVENALRTHVAKSARLVTDESNLYKYVGKRFDGGHYSVNHSRKEYARGDVHTNTVEGFFSLLKRGMIGTFHSVSRKHLHRYVSEFQYRYNTRFVNDGDRTAIAIKKAEGKRLLYREPSL